MASILFEAEGVVDFAFSGELMPEYEREELPSFFELTFEDGTRRAVAVAAIDAVKLDDAASLATPGPPAGS